MIKRDIIAKLHTQLTEFPIVTVLGPRQAGKTTMVRELFADLPYYNFELPDLRQAAADNPRVLLASCPTGAVFDEVQHVNAP